MKSFFALLLAALLGASAGCDDTDEDGGAGGAGGEGGEACEVDASYDPQIDPAAFVAVIDNPLFPLAPGTRFHYAGGDESVEVSVTTDTKTILGVTCTVVRDVVTVEGAVVEDTLDWFAQDSTGTVWYFGEDSKSYEDGQLVSTEGSWEAGVDGAKPGVVMPAQPAVGDAYRQEYSPCVAEDEAEVISTDESVTVPHGTFTGCLQTREFTRLEPDVNEHKYYAPGIGLVLEVDVASGERVELLDVTTF